MKVVGARLPRYDGVGHVTGRTTYVDDVRLPGMLHAAALRSPHHNARITRVDTGAAEAMAGVHAVLTHADVPLLVYGHLSGAGIPGDEPLLAKDHVRYRGQPIAVVAADTVDIARAACAAIEVGYEELPENWKDLDEYSFLPREFELQEGLSFNRYFPGFQIAMAQPLYEEGVEYADGTEATIEQMAYDLSTFLMWAAEPKLEQRKSWGIKVMFFVLVLTVVLYLAKRKIWRDVH